MATSKVRMIVLGILFLAPLGAHAASGITISGENARNRITITVEDAKVDRVLDALRKRFGFDLAGLPNTGSGEALTFTFSGSLHTILERLLRNRNHVIVRSADNASGISKVMILNPTYGAAQTTATRFNGLVGGTADSELMQALTGQGVP
jgi:hypothetical protein